MMKSWNYFNLKNLFYYFSCNPPNFFNYYDIEINYDQPIQVFLFLAQLIVQMLLIHEILLLTQII